MTIQLMLLAFWVVLLLPLTSFCNGNNIMTIKVIGQMHCKDCTDLASIGINVFMSCKSRKQDTNTMGNGPVDKEGKFSITLSPDFENNEYDPTECFAELQSQRQHTSPCPLPNAQTASIKIIHTDTPMIIKFSPITCQSAFFLPHPKFKNLYTSPPHWGPPIEHAPPPLVVTIPPEYLIPPTPSPTYQSPQNRPTPECATTPAPTFQSPNPTFESPYSPSPSPIYTTPPPFSKQIPNPPPKAFHQTPFLPAPVSPIPSQKPITAPPIPVVKPPTPFATSPSPIPSPDPYPPLNRRKSNPIPRAPPVPKLPPIPPVPRKYFNSPNPTSQPPRSS